MMAEGIPANVTSFAEGQVSRESSVHAAGLAAPLHAPHHRDGLGAEGVGVRSDAQLQEKLNGHAKGAAGLVSLFVKPQ